MIKVKANIKLYSDKRKTPFISGYRPMFSFVKEMKTSGKIQLIDREKFYPGDEAEVEILFLSKQYLGDNFGIATEFTFSEGEEPLGEGRINEIVS